MHYTTEKQLMAVQGSEPTIDNSHKIKLRGSDGSVTFDVTPDFIETRNVNYSTMEPLHQPGQIFVYKNTSSRNFNISNARMLSRTIEEANKNLIRLHRLRGWTMPRFGQRSSTLDNDQFGNRQGSSVLGNNLKDTGRDEEFREFFGSEILGAPPQVLELSAYSHKRSPNGKGIAQHIDRVPVVIQQLNIPYPADVDYIPTSTGVPMPIIMTVDITLVETHSPREYEHFSLDHFKRGLLPGF